MEKCNECRWQGYLDCPRRDKDTCKNYSPKPPKPGKSGSLDGYMAGYVCCTKCGHGDIVTRFIEAGKHITASSKVMIENDFVSSIQHDFYYTLRAKKEHLARHCRSCQYEWRENTLDT